MEKTSKRVLILLVLLICALFASCKSMEKTSIDMALVEDSPEWVAQLDQAKDAKQLFVVAGIGKTTAYVSMHQKDENGNWKQIVTTPGFIGKNGLGKTTKMSSTV